MDASRTAPSASARRMWQRCLAALGEASGETARPLSAWHFSDHEAEADALAALVLAGDKRATAPSRPWFEATGTPLPAPGDLHVVTDWDGAAQCVIQTTRVEVVPFSDVTAEHAAAEGEGDGSLEHWRRTHRAYYRRELAGTAFAFAEEMPVVCERFAVVFPAEHADRVSSSSLLPSQQR